MIHTHNRADSSALRGVEFDEDTGVLTVHTKAGTSYQYEGRTKADYDAFAGAKSLGSHWATEYNKKKIKGRRV